MKAKTKLYKLLSLLLCLVMVLGLMPTTALAEGKIPITEFSGSITLPAPVYGETISDNRPTVSTSAPVRFYNHSWQKKIYSDVDAWSYMNSGVFTEGTWRYVLRVKPNNDNYVLDPSLAVTINGEQWKVKYDSTYNWFDIISPEFTVSAPTGGPLQFVAETNAAISDHQIGETVNKDLTQYTAGGTPPYTYSKVSGPEWLNVSADGNITGTANEIQGSSTLKVKVTDANGESVTAPIPVGCVTLKDGDRIPITSISGNIYLPDPVYGENIRDNLPTVYTSDHVYFRNHSWQKKIYSDVDAWNYVNSGVFTEGTWRYIMKVNADDNYVLADTLTVTINGEQWKVMHDYQNNMFHIISPEFTVTAPPTLEGTATLSGAYYNSPVNPELSSDLQTLRGQGKLKFNWQRSANGTSGWTNISGATNAVYNPAENDVGKYIRLVITADGYTSSVISNAVEVKQALINFEKPVMPTLSYDGTNGLVVMNAKANQEYLVTYSNKEPSSWASAEKPSADGSLPLTASQNTTVYVHTRIAETTYKPAGMYTDYNSIYTGTPTYLVDFSINYSKLSLKVGEVVKLTATPIPADATAWQTTPGVQWYSNDVSAKLYKDEACTIEYNRYTDGYAESVYLKGISQKNWFIVGAERTMSGGIPTSRRITVAVTDAEGNYLLERLAFPDVTLAPGESATIDIASYPNPSKILGTMTFEAYAANPASTLVLTPLENNTKLKIEVPADAVLGGYGYDVKLDGTKITTNVWTVTVAEKGIPVDGVTVVPSSATLEPGSSTTLIAVVSPSNHTVTSSVAWSKVSGSDSITVDSDTGKVTVSGSAVDGDTATIRATYGGKYGECVIKVSTIQYGVTVTNGIAYIGDGTMITEAVEGTEVILIADAAPDGEVFDKRKVLSGDVTLADATSATTTFTMPAGEVIVKATYKDKPVTTYTVTFDANGGTGSMADATGVSGEYTLPANGFTAPAGKQFKAWSVDGIEKAVGDKITVTANTTVTAVWEDIPVVTYTVSFDANGGKVTPASATTGADGKLATLPTPTRSGYRFNGWYTAVIGGKKITTSYQFTADTTVYAHWTKKTPSGSSGSGSNSGTTIIQSAKTADIGVMIYGMTALLSLTGGAWVVNKKRKGK